jgi:hypothetical protein
MCQCSSLCFFRLSLSFWSVVMAVSISVSVTVCLYVYLSVLFMFLNVFLNARIHVDFGRRKQHIWQRRDRLDEERDLHQPLPDRPAGPHRSGPGQGEAGLRRDGGAGPALRTVEERSGSKISPQKGI